MAGLDDFIPPNDAYVHDQLTSGSYGYDHFGNLVRRRRRRRRALLSLRGRRTRPRRPRRLGKRATQLYGDAFGWIHGGGGCMEAYGASIRCFRGAAASLPAARPPPSPGLCAPFLSQRWPSRPWRKGGGEGELAAEPSGWWRPSGAVAAGSGRVGSGRVGWGGAQEPMSKENQELMYGTDYVALSHHIEGGPLHPPGRGGRWREQQDRVRLGDAQVGGDDREVPVQLASPQFQGAAPQRPPARQPARPPQREGAPRARLLRGSRFGAP